MAVVVTDNRITIDEADATGTWTGAAGAIASTTFVEAPSAFVGTLNIATGQVYFTTSARDVSNTLIYVWANNYALQGLWTDANPANALHIGDGTDRVSFKMAGSDRKVFAHLTSQDWNWDCLLLDGYKASQMNADGYAVARAGTFASLNLSAITQFGADFTTLSKGLGGGTNVAVDVIRIGNDGLTITGGLTGNRGNFAEIVAEDRSTATGKAFGIIREYNTGVYGLQGPLTFGSAVTGTSWFEDTNATLVFENRNVADDKYYLKVDGYYGAGETHFILDGCSIGSAGPAVRILFDGYGIDELSLNSCAFRNLRGLVKFATDIDGYDHIVNGCVFDRCGQLTPGVVQFTNNTVSNSVATSAMLISTYGTEFISDTSFVSSGTGHALEFTQPGTYDLIGITYSGYGADATTNASVYNNSGGLVTLNIAGGGNTPTVRNAGSSSTVINNNIQITLAGLKANSEVRAYYDDNGNNGDEIDGIENSGTSFSFTVSAETIINIIINHLNYLPADIWQFDSGTADSSIPISQFIDRNYLNPPGPDQLAGQGLAVIDYIVGLDGYTTSGTYQTAVELDTTVDAGYYIVMWEADIAGISGGVFPEVRIIIDDSDEIGYWEGQLASEVYRHSFSGFYYRLLNGAHNIKIEYQGNGNRVEIYRPSIQLIGVSA